MTSLLFLKYTISSSKATKSNLCMYHTRDVIYYLFFSCTKYEIYIPSITYYIESHSIVVFFLFSGMSNVSACIMYARQQSVLKWESEKRITFMLMRWRLECMKMIVLNRRSAGKIAKFNSDCGQNWSCCFWMYRRS